MGLFVEILTRLSPTAPTATAAVTKWSHDLGGLVKKIEQPWATKQYDSYSTGRVPRLAYVQYLSV